MPEPLYIPDSRGGTSGVLIFTGCEGGTITLHCRAKGDMESVRYAMRAATSRRRTQLVSEPNKVVANIVRHLSTNTHDILRLFAGRDDIGAWGRATWRYEITLGSRIENGVKTVPHLLALHEMTGETLYDGHLNEWLGLDLRRRPYIPRGKQRSAKQRGLAEGPDGTIIIQPGDYNDIAQYGLVRPSDPDQWPIDEYTGHRYTEFPTKEERHERFREWGFNPQDPKQWEAIRKHSRNVIRETRAAARESQVLSPPRDIERAASAKGRRVLRLDFSHAYLDEDPDSEDARALDDAVRQ